MSLPSFGAQSNYLHHDHVTQAERRRSVLTLAQRFSHHISPDYPGEKSSVTFPQITHTWSESNLHKVPNPPRRDLTMTPTEEPPGITRGCGGSDCGESRWKNVASALDSELVLIWESLQSPGSALSSHLSFIHHFNFGGNVPLLLQLLACVWLLKTTAGKNTTATI